MFHYFLLLFLLRVLRFVFLFGALWNSETDNALTFFFGLILNIIDVFFFPFTCLVITPYREPMNEAGRETPFQSTGTF